MSGLLAFALTAGLAFAEGPKDVDIDVTLAKKPYGLGAGLVVGKPSGIGLAYKPEHDAWYAQGVVGYNPVFRSIQVTGDFIKPIWRLNFSSMPGVQLPVYTGIGGFVDIGEYRGQGDSFGFGGRLPVGIAFADRDLPFDVFIETALVGGIAPVLLIDLDATVGVRVFFL